MKLPTASSSKFCASSEEEKGCFPDTPSLKESLNPKHLAINRTLLSKASADDERSIVVERSGGIESVKTTV